VKKPRCKLEKSSEQWYDADTSIDVQADADAELPVLDICTHKDASYG